MKNLLVWSVVNHSAFSGARVALSLSGLEMRASAFSIGLMLSFISLLPMFLSVPGGRWVDRVGLKRPMLGGTALLALGVAAPFVGWDLGALFFSAVAIGTGFMAFHIGMQKAAGELSPGGGPPDDATRRHNFSLLALGFSVSGFVGPMSAGVLIDTLGHRAAFGVLAGMAATSGLGLLAWFARTRMPAMQKRLPDAAGEGGVADLLREPRLRRLYLAVALLSSAWDVHQFLVPIYGAQLGLSASLIGLVLGAFSAATFVVRTVLPLLARRVGEWPLILTALGTAATVYALYPFFPVLPAMLVLSFALGLGLGCAQPMVLSVLHKAAPSGRVGEAVGLRVTLISATQTFLPTLFGALGGLLGIGALFWGMALLVGAGAGRIWQETRKTP